MIDIAKWSFVVGHVFNDLCASMWFLFTLPFLTKVLKLENSTAGDILLIGQIFDAIATPIIGIESDSKGFICGAKIGQRKSWHLLGTVLTAISFPFIFISFFDIQTAPNWYWVVYYTPFVAVFQFAWATVQVTHLSLIPIMVQEGHDNSSLNSLRYMFTITANVVVLVSTTALFYYLPYYTHPGNSSAVSPSQLTINPEDKPVFRYLSIGIVITGLVFSIIFQLGVREKNSSPPSDEETYDSKSHPATELSSLISSSNVSMSKSDWFKEPQFYVINCMYLSSRLIVNVSQVYLVVYVTESLGLIKIMGPLAALTTFVSGAVSSILLKKVQQLISKKICFLIGLLFISAYCVIVSFSSFGGPLWQMYLSMAILGIGCSIVMIGSLSITADLIGKSCSSSAFVYGCMSFSDKLSSGIVIWLLQKFGPLNQDCRKCNIFYKDIQLYFIGGCVIFSLIILLLLLPMKVGQRRRDVNIQQDHSTNSERT